MIVTLKDSAAVKTDLVLIHGPGDPSSSYAQGPIGSDEVFESSANIQVVPIIRAVAARVRSRGNRSATFPFGALRLFGSHEAARAWAASHAAALDGYNRLVIADGSSTVTLSGAVSPVRCIVRGITVEIQYTFVYGAVATA